MVAMSILLLPLEHSGLNSPLTSLLKTWFSFPLNRKAETSTFVSRSRLVGVYGLVTEKEEEYTFGSYILRLRVKKDSHIPPEYIVSFINSDLGQAQIRMLETGAFGKNINTRQVKMLEIPIPSSDITIDQIVSEIRNTWEKLNVAENETKMAWAESRREFVNLFLE